MESQACGDWQHGNTQTHMHLSHCETHKQLSPLGQWGLVGHSSKEKLELLDKLQETYGVVHESSEFEALLEHQTLPARTSSCQQLLHQLFLEPGHWPLPIPCQFHFLQGCPFHNGCPS